MQEQNGTRSIRPQNTRRPVSSCSCTNRKESTSICGTRAHGIPNRKQKELASLCGIRSQTDRGVVLDRCRNTKELASICDIITMLDADTEWNLLQSAASSSGPMQKQNGTYSTRRNCRCKAQASNLRSCQETACGLGDVCILETACGFDDVCGCVFWARCILETACGFEDMHCTLETACGFNDVYGSSDVLSCTLETACGFKDVYCKASAPPIV